MSITDTPLSATGPMQRFVVPQLPLEGPKDLVLQFPSGWDVEMRVSLEKKGVQK